MVAAITEYTNTDAIRAAVGLDDDEIPDEMLVDQGLAIELELDLGEWLSSHATIWAEGVAASPTADQKTAQQHLQMYSMWYCAIRALEMRLAIPSLFTDGKAEARRQEIKYEELEEMAKTRAENHKKALLGTTTSTPTFMSAAVPDYDPVTNLGSSS